MFVVVVSLAVTPPPLPLLLPPPSPTTTTTTTTITTTCCVLPAPGLYLLTRTQLFIAKQKVSSIQKKVQPWKLYTMVSALLAIDIIILGAWQGLDPLQRRIEVFPLEASTQGDDDARIRPELEHCESEHNSVWLGKNYRPSVYQILLFSSFFLDKMVANI